MKQIQMDMQKPGHAHSPSFGDDFITTDDRLPVSSPDHSFSFSVNTPSPAGDLADSVFSNGWILPTLTSPRSRAVPDPIDLGSGSGSSSVSSSDEIELDSPWHKSRIRDLLFRGKRGLSDVKSKFENLRWRKARSGKRDMDMGSVYRLLYAREKTERKTTLLPYSQDLLSGFFGGASRRATPFDLRVVRPQ